MFLVLGFVLRKINLSDREIISPLECGFSPSVDRRQPVSLRFFIFAVIFVVFDIELILVLPLLSTSSASPSVIWVFVVLVLLLRVGLVIEWNNRAFEWLKFSGSFKAFNC